MFNRAKPKKIKQANDLQRMNNKKTKKRKRWTFGLRA
jgi:hypothetical protein